MSMIWLNRLQVSQVVVIPCLRIVSPRDRKSGRSSQEMTSLRAMKQSAPNFEGRGVEIQRRKVQKDLRTVQLHGRKTKDKAGNRAVGHDDAFWNSR